MTPSPSSPPPAPRPDPARRCPTFAGAPHLRSKCGSFPHFTRISIRARMLVSSLRALLLRVHRRGLFNTRLPEPPQAAIGFSPARSAGNRRHIEPARFSGRLAPHLPGAPHLRSKCGFFPRATGATTLGVARSSRRRRRLLLNLPITRFPDYSILPCTTFVELTGSSLHRTFVSPQFPPAHIPAVLINWIRVHRMLLTLETRNFGTRNAVPDFLRNFALHDLLRRWKSPKPRARCGTTAINDEVQYLVWGS